MKYIFSIIIFFLSINLSIAQNKIDEDNYIDVTNQNKAIENKTENKNRKEAILKKETNQLNNLKNQMYLLKVKKNGTTEYEMYYY